MPLNKAQLARLQTLYGQLARHQIGIGTGRADRLAWAAESLHKPVRSFSDLSGADAGFLIDVIQTTLGVKAPAAPRKRVDRDQARRAGLDGRADSKEYSGAPQLASAGDLKVIDDYYTRLGWDRFRFDSWLRSSRSPLKHKSAPTIVTVADANRVRWALKGMLVHAGKWEKR
jgi:hypothetical protein